MVWVKLIVCIAIIFFFGRRVAKYGDVIAHRTGLGRVWTGLVIIAVVTSLPELFTGVSAITLVDAPDLTVGNLFGANTFNLLSLALLDIVHRNGSLLSGISASHRLTGWFSLVLVVIAALPIFIGPLSTAGAGWIGWYTPVIILLYLVFARHMFRHEQRQPYHQEAKPDYGEISPRKTYLHFAIAAAFIIGAGIWLAMIGEEIAVATGWGESFVGSLFLAFTTTLPEITVSFAAMRMGASDLAIATLIGSNLFNMTIIPLNDLIYLKGSVLAAVSDKQLITALTVIAMTLIFIAGLRFRPKRRFRLSWFSISLIVLFIIGAYFSFTPA